MKKIFIFSLISIIMFGLSPEVRAFSFNDAGNAYLNRAKYYPRNSVYVDRYRRPNKNYIYTPQQARYNGYRTGVNGTGYNNTYYYNRYRR